MRAGTRASRLARAQTGIVAGLLQATNPGLEVTEHLIETAGDRSVTGEVSAGDGMFVTELQQALLRGEIDLAVHSYKDMPTEPVAGLTVAAVPLRTDPRDTLIGSALASLAAGARVGTSSPRRAAQLLAARPDLRPVPIRGNVDTRVAKVRAGDYDAAVLAAAGLIRLGLDAGEPIDPEVMLPAPAQGALAVQIRDDDAAAAAIARTIDDPVSRRCADTERAVLRELGGGCLLPVGVLAEPAGPAGALRVRAAAVSPDGGRAVRIDETIQEEPAVAGKRVAAALIAAGALEVIG